MPKPGYELHDKRNRQMKQRRLSDGNIEIILQNRQHFRSGKQWIDWDAFGLSEKGGKVYSSSDDMAAVFATNSVTLEFLDIKAHFTFEGLYVDDELFAEPLPVAPVVENGVVIYHDIFDGVDLKYVVTPDAVEEHVVFKRNILVGTPACGEMVSFRTRETGSVSVPEWIRQDAFSIDARGTRREAKYEVDGGIHSKGVPSSVLYKAAYPLALDPSYSINPLIAGSLYNQAGSWVYDGVALKTGQNGVPYDLGSGNSGYNFSFLRGFEKIDLSIFGGTTFSAASLECNKSQNSNTDPTITVSGCADIMTSVGTEDWNMVLTTALGSITDPTTGVFVATDNPANVLTWVNANKGGMPSVRFVGGEIGDNEVGYTPNVFTTRLVLVTNDLMSTFTANVGDATATYQSSTNWATTRDAAVAGSVTANILDVLSSRNGSLFYLIGRGFVCVDTSGLPDDAVMVAGVLEAKKNTVNGTQSYCLVGSTQASPTTVVAADYNKVGSVAFASNRPTNIAAGTMIVFNLNAAGLAAVNKTGYTKFAIRTAYDFDNIAPTAGSTGGGILSTENYPITLSLIYTSGGGGGGGATGKQYFYQTFVVGR